MEDLTSHGNIRGRKIVAEILESGLEAADPYNNTQKLFRIENDRLIIGNPHFEPIDAPKSGEEAYPLNKFKRIFVIGAGKGVQRIAKAVEDVLGDYLTDGHVIDKHGSDVILKKIGVTFGAHPVPDEGCIKGCQKILALTQDLTKDDLVITIAANGISSLLTLPVPGVSLEDVQKVTRMMQIERGVPTLELNAIRNHLDRLKGGRISKCLYPAKMVHIVVFPPGDYESLMFKNHWLHTLPDSSTFNDAVMILKKWGAWDEVPNSVRKHLMEAKPENETPKAKDFTMMDFRVYGIMPEKMGMFQAAQNKALELGFKPIVIARDLQAEASQAGLIMATIAGTIEKENMPFQAPCALFTTGEILVTVGEVRGIGGRNQEYALAAAPKIAGSKQIVIGAVDTDGTDGPGTQLLRNNEILPCLAGGIVDGETMNEAKKLGIDLMDDLNKHNSSVALWKMKSGILATPNISMNDLGVTLIMD
jgi:glycerate-2-kinase